MDDHAVVDFLERTFAIRLNAKVKVTWLNPVITIAVFDRRGFKYTEISARCNDLMVAMSSTEFFERALTEAIIWKALGR